MLSKMLAVLVMVSAMGLMIGCSTGSATKEERDTLVKQSQTSRQEWNKVDPQLEAFAKKGQGFVFFPEITKGGLLVGGANGHGVVYEKGQQIGYAELTQISVGFQAGGQTYSELIVFENQPAMDRFKRNEIDFGPMPPQLLRRKAPQPVPSSLTESRCSSSPRAALWPRRPLAARRSLTRPSDRRTFGRVGLARN
jgi:hypothetical protein